MNNNKFLDSPCTITEAAQLATAAANDVFNNYRNSVLTPQLMSLSMHIDVIKDILVSEGFISEEEYVEKFTELVEEFKQLDIAKLAKVNQEDDISLKFKAEDIEVTQE